MHDVDPLHSPLHHQQANKTTLSGTAHNLTLLFLVLPLHVFDHPSYLPARVLPLVHVAEVSHPHARAPAELWEQHTTTPCS